MNTCYMLLVVSTGERVTFGIWAPHTFCPAPLSREQASKQMKNRFRKTECKSVYMYEMGDSRQDNYISLPSSESHRLILPFLRWIWFLQVFLWGRMEKSIQPRPKLCCDLSVAPHEGRLATESGTLLAAALTKCTSVSIASIRTLMAPVPFIH